MRIAVVSDLHSNLEALHAIDDLLESADRVVCLGDFVGYYCQVNEVIEAMREREAVCVLGNHDYFLLGSADVEMNPAVRFGIEFASAVISQDNRDWLSGLPLTWGGEIGGLSWLLVHGSPWRPLDDYMYGDSPLILELERFEYDVVAFGQTHRPLCRGGRKPTLINPGSVGQSRHHLGVACVALVNTAPLEVEMIEREYDVGPVLRLARSHGAGDWIEKHLAG